MDKKPSKIQRRKPIQARALQKYNAVLDACTQVLLNHNYRNITIQEISLEADVAVPTIYQYFENKDAILVAWVNRVVDNVLGSVINTESKLNASPPDTHIEPLLKTAVMAVHYYRPALQRLLLNVPDVLTAQLLSAIENKTLSMLKQLYQAQFQQGMSAIQLEARLTLLIWLISGYFIQGALNSNSAFDTEYDTQELSTLVRLYLEQHQSSGTA